jgi:cytochrome P450
MIDRRDPATGLGYYVGFDGNAVVIVLNPEHVDAVLESTVVHMLHGLRPASVAFFGQKVLFVLEGGEWQELRQLMRPAFTRDMIPGMVGDTAAKAGVWADVLAPYADSGTPIDMVLAASMYHLSSVSLASFHHDLGCIERFEDGPNAINRAFEFMLTELPRRAFAGEGTPLQCDFESENEDNRRWREAASTVRDEISAIVAARHAAVAHGDSVPPDIMGAMLGSYADARKQQGLAPPSVEELVADVGDNLVEMLFAGYNTVVNVIANGLFFLAREPKWFKPLQEEIDAVCGGRVPTAADVPKLDLCRSLFMESLRLAPPAAVLGRQLSEDLQLGGVTLPKGTEICLPAFAAHLNEAAWGLSAPGFDLRRFAKGAPQPPAGAFIPFSGGRRACMGQHFAELEAVCAFAVLLQQYTFKVPDDYNWSLIFTGFGYRPLDPANACVGLRLIPVGRA